MTWPPGSYFQRDHRSGRGPGRAAVRRRLHQPGPIIKGGKFLPARAAETLATLLLVAASCTLTLVPQSVRLVGVEILIIVVPMLVITIRSQLRQRRQNRDDPVLWTISRMTSTAMATVPCALAGLSLAVHWGARCTGRCRL